MCFASSRKYLIFVVVQKSEAESESTVFSTTLPLKERQNRLRRSDIVPGILLCHVSWTLMTTLDSSDWPAEAAGFARHANITDDLLVGFINV